MKYVCTVCGYVYDEETGDPDNGIAPGTPRRLHLPALRRRQRRFFRRIRQETRGRAPFCGGLALF